MLLSGCNDREPAPQRAFNNETEIRKINHLFAIGNEASVLWPGYDLPLTHPLLLVFSDESGNENIGYLLNVTQPPAGSIEMDRSQVNDLVVYRNDGLVEMLKEKFGTQLPPFAFDVELEGLKYFMVKQLKTAPSPYIAYKNQSDNDFGLLVTHELFHLFQINTPWNLSAFKQDYMAYPQTQEMIALSLLLSDQMRLAYGSTDTDLFLQRYVSIRQRQLQIDPSPQQLVRFQALYTESVEGSARYVEHFGALATTFPTIGNDPTHTFQAQLDTVAVSVNLARHILVQRIPYHVGAIVIHLLRTKNVDMATALRNGETPYSQARTYLNRTDDHYSQVLTALQQSVDWQKYMSRAAELEALLN